VRLSETDPRRRASAATAAPRCAPLLACISVAFVLSGAARPAPGPRLSLSAASQYATGADPQAFAIADLNGDRRPDVVTANSDGKSVSVLRNRGNGTFAPKRDYRVGGEASSILVAELNGDAKPDLVVRRGNSFSVLLNRGDGRFVQGQSTEAGLSCEDCFATADLNGDRRADVVTVGDVVSVFVNRGDGTFVPSREYVVAGPDVGEIVLADLNRDGRPDIATAAVRRVSVLLNRGDGSFGPLRNYKARVCACTGSLVAADLNRDNAIDLVSTEQYEDKKMDFASVLLNRGHGTFLRAHKYAIGTNVGSSSALADLNGDSAPELIAQYEGRVAVFINRGNGTFRRKRDYSTPGFFHFTVADVNGGGAPDLVFSSWDLGRVGVLLNRGHGRFSSLLQYRTLGGPVSLAVADLNGDRTKDVLTLSNATEGPGNRVSVLLNMPGLCNVQDVFQKNLVGARATIAHGGCRLGRVTWGHSTVKRGHVMAQRPRFGAVLREGGRVNIVLSLGQRR
jgi:FG-GAP-like repeat